jgi:NAD(P)H-nitrite reductase large subunit
VIATGARCFVPPLPGAELPEVFTLRNFGDFRALRAVIDNGAGKIVVLGGGLLGLEVANSLMKLGVDVTVLEMAPRILPRQLDEASSEMLMRVVDASKVKVITGSFAEEIAGDARVRGVVTDKHGVIECDAVIVSVGIRANIDLALDAGIEVDRGIVVNERMQTSHADIYAVGDCVSFNGVMAGLWEPAMEQGRVAGAHIAGENLVYEPPVVGATLNAFGTSVFSVGELVCDMKGCVKVVYRNDMKPLYKTLCFGDGKLSGGVLLGDLSLTNQLLSGVKKRMNYEMATDNKLV